MTITIKINTENAAFEDRDAEIARILTQIAREFECMSPSVLHGVRDSNGNTVGSVKVTGK